jgi:sulfur relay (sulfurtransferase) complex TusBCD TusD component (DsrE family)
VKYLFILNDPPYGTERSYNGLRLALSLGKEEDVEIFVFLMGDAASCAVSGQNTPRGYYSLERMLKGSSPAEARSVSAKPAWTLGGSGRNGWCPEEPKARWPS